MEMLSNCSNDIYNHVAFLHVSSRVNSIRVSLFFRASFNFKCARFTFPTKLKTVSTGKKFPRKVSKKSLELFKFGNENHFTETFGNPGSKIK